MSETFDFLENREFYSKLSGKKRLELLELLKDFQAENEKKRAITCACICENYEQKTEKKREKQSKINNEKMSENFCEKTDEKERKTDEKKEKTDNKMNEKGNEKSSNQSQLDLQDEGFQEEISKKSKNRATRHYSLVSSNILLDKEKNKLDCLEYFCEQLHAYNPPVKIPPPGSKTYDTWYVYISKMVDEYTEEKVRQMIYFLFRGKYYYAQHIQSTRALWEKRSIYYPAFCQKNPEVTIYSDQTEWNDPIACRHRWPVGRDGKFHWEYEGQKDYLFDMINAGEQIEDDYDQACLYEKNERWIVELKDDAPDVGDISHVKRWIRKIDWSEEVVDENDTLL